MPGMYNIIKWAWHHFMQSFPKPNYIAESSISKLGEIIKSSNNYCLIKKWYGGIIVITLLKVISIIKESSKRWEEKCIQKT
jgi:hypothetical protein